LESLEASDIEEAFSNSLTIAVKGGVIEVVSSLGIKEKKQNGSE
jgi:hypothetical protein